MKVKVRVVNVMPKIQKSISLIDMLNEWTNEIIKEDENENFLSTNNQPSSNSSDVCDKCKEKKEEKNDFDKKKVFAESFASYIDGLLINLDLIAQGPAIECGNLSPEKLFFKNPVGECMCIHPDETESSVVIHIHGGLTNIYSINRILKNAYDICVSAGYFSDKTVVNANIMHMNIISGYAYPREITIGLSVTNPCPLQSGVNITTERYPVNYQNQFEGCMATLAKVFAICYFGLDNKIIVPKNN